MIRYVYQGHVAIVFPWGKSTQSSPCIKSGCLLNLPRNHVMLIDTRSLKTKPTPHKNLQVEKELPQTREQRRASKIRKKAKSTRREERWIRLVIPFRGIFPSSQVLLIPISAAHFNPLLLDIDVCRRSLRYKSRCLLLLLIMAPCSRRNPTWGLNAYPSFLLWRGLSI